MPGSSQIHGGNMIKSNPLDGLKVLDFSLMGMGPMAGFLLQQLGAHVTKVELRRLGDPLKNLPFFSRHAHSDTTEIYHQLNQNKKICSFDWTSPKDIQWLHNELRDTDILIESFPPGRMAGLGLRATELLQAYPNLFFVSISSYGQKDLRSLRHFHEANIMAENGVLAMLHPPGERINLHPGPAMTVSWALCVQVMARLLNKDISNTSEYRWIDISVDEIIKAQSMFLWADEIAQTKTLTPGHMVGSCAHSRVYMCANETAVVVSLPEPKLFNKLKSILLNGNYADDELNGLTECFLTRTSYEWECMLSEHELHVTAVRMWNGEIWHKVPMPER